MPSKVATCTLLPSCCSILEEFELFEIAIHLIELARWVWLNAVRHQVSVSTGRMLLGKLSRFVKRYDLTLNHRHMAAARYNLVDKAEMPPVLKAIHRAIRNDKASTTTANSDEVELRGAIHEEPRGVVVLLFHRGSSNAADPMFRKKDVKSRAVTVRAATRAPYEGQLLSAHFSLPAAAIHQPTPMPPFASDDRGWRQAGCGAAFSDECGALFLLQPLPMAACTKAADQVHP